MTTATEARPVPPARRLIPAIREAIERVLLSLRRLPAKVDRAPLKADLDAALAALSLLAKSEIDHADHIDLIDRIADRITRARATLAAAGKTDAAARGEKAMGRLIEGIQACKEATLDAIVADQERTLRAGPRRDEAPPVVEFRASVGLPTLHILARAPLVPLVNVAPEEPDDEDDEVRHDEDEDDDEAAKEAKRAHKASLQAAAAAKSREEDQVRRLARDCMEDVAILSGLRRLNEDEPWPSVSRFEDRLLAALDALVSLTVPAPGAQPAGDVLEQLLEYAMEPSFIDPGRTFARAFVLGSIEGEDAIRALIVGLRQSHPLTYAAQREALSLAPSPLIDRAMEALLGDSDPLLVKLGLDVLRARRKVTLALSAPLLHHPDPRVLEAAIRSLSAAEPREGAIAAIERAVSEGLDDRAALSAAESLLLLGSQSGLSLVKRALDEESAAPGALPEDVRQAYVRLLALAGGPESAALLLNSVTHESSGALAIGWFGHADLVAPLLVKLRAGNEVRRSIGPYPTPFEVAAAQALVRITGVYIENQAEELNITLSIDAEEWALAWEERRERFQPGVKYRFGKPYHPGASLDELCDEAAPPDVRWNAALEAAIASGRSWAFEPDDWVARQYAEIEGMRLFFREASGAYPAGEWPGRRLTRTQA